VNASRGRTNHDDVSGDFLRVDRDAHFERRTRPPTKRVSIPAMRWEPIRMRLTGLVDYLVDYLWLRPAAEQTGVVLAAFRRDRARAGRALRRP
jgi:hypothetical protein